MLALRLCIGQRLAHVAGVTDRFAADIEDDVAGLEAVFSGGAFRIDGRDDNTLAAGTGHFIRRRQPQPDMRHAAIRLCFPVAGVGLSLVGQLTERDGQRLRFSVSENIELDRTAGSQRRHLAGEIAGVLDRSCR